MEFFIGFIKVVFLFATAMSLTSNYPKILRFIFFEKRAVDSKKDYIHALVCCAFVITALFGVVNIVNTFFLKGYDVFLHEKWYSFLKWITFFVLFYSIRMYIDYKISMYIVKSYNSAVRRVVSSIMHEGSDFSPASTSHKKLKEYFSSNRDNKDHVMFKYYFPLIEEHLLSERGVYTSIEELNDDAFIRRNIVQDIYK